jgi:hypothetical protein
MSFKVLHIGGSLRCGRYIMQFPAALKSVEASDHREHRRHANTTGNQNRMGRVLDQGEVILGRRYLEDIARTPSFVDVARTAPTRRR